MTPEKIASQNTDRRVSESTSQRQTIYGDGERIHGECADGKFPGDGDEAAPRFMVDASRMNGRALLFQPCNFGQSGIDRRRERSGIDQKLRVKRAHPARHEVAAVFEMHLHCRPTGARKLRGENVSRLGERFPKETPTLAIDDGFRGAENVQAEDTIHPAQNISSPEQSDGQIANLSRSNSRRGDPRGGMQVAVDHDRFLVGLNAEDLASGGV